MPPVEAMACGCPVISSTRGSLGEIVGDSAVIVDPEELHTIARALFRLATDAPLRNQLRAFGLARARQFDWSATAAKTLEVYQQACHGTLKSPQPVLR